MIGHDDAVGYILLFAGGLIGLVSIALLVIFAIALFDPGFCGLSF